MEVFTLRLWQHFQLLSNHYMQKQIAVANRTVGMGLYIMNDIYKRHLSSVFFLSNIGETRSLENCFSV